MEGHCNVLYISKSRTTTTKWSGEWQCNLQQEQQQHQQASRPSTSSSPPLTVIPSRNNNSTVIIRIPLVSLGRHAVTGRNECRNNTPAHQNKCHSTINVSLTAGPTFRVPAVAIRAAVARLNTAVTGTNNEQRSHASGSHEQSARPKNCTNVMYRQIDTECIEYQVSASRPRNTAREVVPPPAASKEWNNRTTRYGNGGMHQEQMVNEQNNEQIVTTMW